MLIQSMIAADQKEVEETDPLEMMKRKKGAVGSAVRWCPDDTSSRVNLVTVNNLGVPGKGLHDELHFNRCERQGADWGEGTVQGQGEAQWP